MVDEDNMPNFVLLKPVYWDTPMWVEDCGSIWWGEKLGGQLLKKDTDKILEKVQAEDFCDLDWTKTGLVIPNSTFGWLSPDGKFIGCHYMDHDVVAHFILKTDVSVLEKQGWCRIAEEFYCERRLTAYQRNWLSRAGFVVSDWD